MDLPREVCLPSGVDWLKLICQPEGGERSVVRCACQCPDVHVWHKQNAGSDRDAHFDCASCPAFICSDVYVFPKPFRAQKMCESRGGHPGLSIPNNPYTVMVSVDVKRE